MHILHRKELQGDFSIVSSFVLVITRCLISIGSFQVEPVSPEVVLSKCAYMLLYAR